MDTTALITFLTALFFLEITPGPDMMLVLARGIGQGRRIALLTAVGQILVSGTVQVALLVLGVASLLQAHPSGLAALQWIGAAYLIYLGAKMLRSSMNGGAAITARHCSTSWQAVREGAVCNLTNPKSLLFMFAFLPQFVNPGASFPVWGQLLVLGSIQKLTGIFSLGGCCRRLRHGGTVAVPLAPSARLAEAVHGPGHAGSRLAPAFDRRGGRSRRHGRRQVGGRPAFTREASSPRRLLFQ